MEIILFTKFFRGCGAEEVGAAAKELGVDGLDLAVRSGQCVTPTNVRQELPQAMRVWRDMGLTVPLVTLEGNATDPQAADVQEIYAACGEAGVTHIKLGYWLWQPGQDYWQGVADIRRALDGFQKLSEKYNICSLLHTHSDDFYFSNAAGAMHVVQGFDPRYIGVYLDPAHLAADGESVPMALSIVGRYFRMLGVKNVRYIQKEDGSGWDKEWCTLANGLVDWKAALPWIKQAGYSGPLVLHAEYSRHRDKEGGLRLAAEDVPFLKSVLSNRSCN